MASPFNLLTRIGDKAGSVGALVSTMGCAVCFPALASIGAAVGLGFLSQWEGVLVSTLLPLFAAIVLLANALGWFSHKQWHRSALGMIGPVLVLTGRYTFISSVLYTGLVVMLAVAIWDLISPANRRCRADSCELPPKRG